MLGLLNLKVLAGIGLAGLIAIGAAGYKGYSYGYELAELRCNSRVQAIKDEIARHNERIRAEEARRRHELEALIERRTAEAVAASKAEAAARRRAEEYKASLNKRGDSCPLTEEDVRQLQ